MGQRVEAEAGGRDRGKGVGREGTEDGGIGSGLVIVLISRLDGKENRCCIRLHADKLDPFYSLQRTAQTHIREPRNARQQQGDNDRVSVPVLTRENLHKDREREKGL